MEETDSSRCGQVVEEAEKRLRMRRNQLRTRRTCNEKLQKNYFRELNKVSARELVEISYFPDVERASKVINRS